MFSLINCVFPLHSVHCKPPLLLSLFLSFLVAYPLQVLYQTIQRLRNVCLFKAWKEWVRHVHTTRAESFDRRLPHLVQVRWRRRRMI